MSDQRVVRLAVAAVAMMVMTAACSSGKGGASLAGKVDSGPPVSTPATEITTSTTALSVGSLVLSADGLGPLRFGTQAARALAGLTQALGQAAPPTPVPDGAACGATRIFRWKNFAVIVNEVAGRSGAMAGLVGWSSDGTVPVGVNLSTDKGIGVGSTVKALRTAYGENVAFAAGGHGPAFTVTTPTGVITGDLDAATDTGKVRALQAGTVCE